MEDKIPDSIETTSVADIKYSAITVISELIGILSISYDTTFLKDYLRLLQIQSAEVIKYNTYQMMMVVEDYLREVDTEDSEMDLDSSTGNSSGKSQVEGDSDDGNTGGKSELEGDLGEAKTAGKSKLKDDLAEGNTAGKSGVEYDLGEGNTAGKSGVEDDLGEGNTAGKSVGDDLGVGNTAGKSGVEGGLAEGNSSEKLVARDDWFEWYTSGNWEIEYDLETGEWNNSRKLLDDYKVVLGAFLCAIFIWDSPAVPRARYLLLQLLSRTTEEQRIVLAETWWKFGSLSVLHQLSDVVNMHWKLPGISLRDLFLRGALCFLSPERPMPEWQLGFPSIDELKKLIVAVKDEVMLPSFVARILSGIPRNLRADVLQLFDLNQPTEEMTQVRCIRNTQYFSQSKLLVLYGKNEEKNINKNRRGNKRAAKRSNSTSDFNSKVYYSR